MEDKRWKKKEKINRQEDSLLVLPHIAASLLTSVKV
jgi:hypothetical protein